MPESEILPQSIVDTKTIVLKLRLDNSDIQLIGKEIGPKLFSKFGFKPKPEDVKLLHCENYFEPYLIIEGKYALDYCKKHVFEVDVNERTSKLFIGGREFSSEQLDLKATKKTIKLTGEEYSHYERQTYFILDRMKREIQPEILPIAPFYIQEENAGDKSSFRRICIPDETQIGLLKTKIAKRPADVAEIIREKFDVTERVIAYYPMFELTFENAKNRKIATIVINGITGEVILNGVKRIFKKTIVDSPKNEETQSLEKDLIQFEQEPAPITTKKALTEEKPISLPQYVEEETCFGDLEIPSGTCMNKTVFVKGNLKIGNNCRIHGNLKALKSITVGADTIIDGDLNSGEDIFLGSHSLVSGSVETAGTFEIEENAIVEGFCIQRSSH